MPSFSKSKFPWIILLAVEISAAALLVNAAFHESAIVDEIAHIPAGYGYVKYLDYRLNPEHPPLVKALAALPLRFMNLKFATENFEWKDDVNGQWAAGGTFLYGLGNDAEKIIHWARVGPILLTLLLILVVFLWSAELLGQWWALLPAILIGFSPTVLAHGHYVTTDVGATLGIFIATWAFVKYMEHGGGRRLLLAGLAFGMAQLMKFSAVLLVPLFLAIIFFAALRRGYLEGWGRGFKNFFSLLGSTLGIFIIGAIVIYAVYFLFTFNEPLNRQYRDANAILQSFNGGPDPSWQTCKPPHLTTRCVADLDIWMSGSKIWHPLGKYLLGVLMVGQRAAGGNTGYFLGEVSAAGWWYYFPVVFLLKEPLPSLTLIALAFLLALWGIFRTLKANRSTLKTFSDYIGIHLPEFSLLLFIILYWAYSIESSLNIGIRHILPTMPFLYILTAAGIKRWMSRRKAEYGGAVRRFFMALGQFARNSLKSLIISLLLLWYLIGTLAVTPHYLSFFNALGGGISNGYKYVTDSNYDWGQDLKYLAEWVSKNLPAGRQVAVDYFGGGSPEYYLNGIAVRWQSSNGNPKDQGINWLAISANTLQGAKGAPHPGFVRKPEDEYRWLNDPYHPYARAGESIFIYKL